MQYGAVVHRCGWRFWASALTVAAFAGTSQARQAPARSAPVVEAAKSPSPRQMVPAIAQPGPVTAKVDLGAEFSQMQGFAMTQAVTTVAPNTGRPWHSHAGSPEIVRVLSGVLTDVRGSGCPIAYGPGAVILNIQGIEHMWANLGAVPVVFVATSVKKL